MILQHFGLVASVFVCHFGYACGGQDGAWWRTLPADAKTPVVQAAIASYRAGFSTGQFMMYSDYLDVYAQKTDAQTVGKLRARLDAGASTVPVFSKPVSAYVAAIDRFYAAYPDKMQVNIAGLMRCLRDNPEVPCDTVGKAQYDLPWPTGP